MLNTIYISIDKNLTIFFLKITDHSKSKVEMVYEYLLAYIHM